MLDFGKSSYNDFVLVRSDFLRFVEAPNEFLILVIIYYMFKYTFGIKTNLLESHRGQKRPLKVDFGKTTYNDLVLARSEFFKVFGDQNESLRLIIIYYMFKYTFGIKKNFVRVTSEPNKTFSNARFRQNKL